MFESTTFPPGMEANLTEGAREGTRAGLEFRAPSGETISGGDITVVPLGRGEGGEPGGPVASQLATGRLEDVFWEGVNNRIKTVAIPAGGRELFASVLCRSMPGGQRCYVETLFVLAATILLTPNLNPSVSALSGPLTTSGPQHGTQDVSFTATDPGGPGIYQVTATIDGKVVYQATPNLNGGACAPVGTYHSALEFYYRLPVSPVGAREPADRNGYAARWDSFSHGHRDRRREQCLCGFAGDLPHRKPDLHRQRRARRAYRH